MTLTESVSVTSNRYTINGKQYPRLSVVTSQHTNIGLEEWKKRVGEEEAQRIANEAAEYGTKVHLITALHDNAHWKALDHMLELSTGGWEILHWAAWSNWVEEFVKEIIAVEIVVWTNRFWCAGRVDRVAVMKGDRSASILDIKTGSLNDDLGIDLAGYRYMWNERSRRKAKRRLVVHMPRDKPGELRVKEYSKDTDQGKWEVMCADYLMVNGG